MNCLKACVIKVANVKIWTNFCYGSKPSCAITVFSDNGAVLLKSTTSFQINPKCFQKVAMDFDFSIDWLSLTN